MSHSATAGPGTGASAQQTDEIVQLQFDQDAHFRDIQLRWLTLEDSRCPIGATCIWAGQIVVTLEVVRGEETEAIVVSLHHSLKGEPESANAFGYELRLLAVDPHPKEGKQPARGDYRMRVEIVSP